MRSFLRRLGLTAWWLAFALVAVGQVVAWTPPQWWVPVLQLRPAQYVIVAAGFVRDALGAWTVVVAVLLLLAAVIVRRREHRSRRRVVPLLAAAVVVSSVALTVHQVVQARSAGADVGWFEPVVPFTQGTRAFDEEVVVGRVDGAALTAQLSLPDEREGPVPVVVRVHGGGFTSGAPAPQPYYPALLDGGIAVLDVSYRLATPDRPTWDLAAADVGCALTWVRTQGPEAGLDPDRVGLLGDSAGGQLAINAANLTSRGELEPSCGRAEDLPTPRAVATLYPAVDGAAAYEQSSLGAGYGEQYVGGSEREFPERYAVTDSVHHIGPDGAPLLIVQGGADHVILPGPVRRFAEQSRAAGTRTQYVELPGQEHVTGGGLGTLSLGALVARDLFVQWFERYL